MRISKILGVLSGAVLMLLSANTVLAESEWVTVDGIEGGQIKFDAETGTITDCEASVTSAVIPNFIQGVEVQSIAEEAFRGSDIKSVLVPEGVKKIGYEAFCGCSSLEKVILPESVTDFTSRGSTRYLGAFGYCEKLVSAGPIGSGCNIEFAWTENIPAGAFAECGTLASVTIPEGVKMLSYDAFKECVNLEKVIIPSTVESVGYKTGWDDDGAFRHCQKLTSAGPLGGDYSIEFGWETAIPEGAFADCSSLVTVMIPDGIMTIGGECFDSCTSLEKVVLPSSLMNVGLDHYGDLGNIFWGNPKLTSAGPVGSDCSIEFGWRVRVPDFAFAGCDGLTSAVLPEGIVSIGQSAFSSCGKLSEVTLPSTLREIGTRVFSYCDSIKMLKLPDNLTEIGSYAFYSCDNLVKVEMPKNLTYISSGMFEQSGLTEIDIPDGITEIQDHAFAYCKKLTTVRIPYSVTDIESYAFCDCDSLVKINIPANADVGYRSFADCDSLTTARIPRIDRYSGCNNVYAESDKLAAAEVVSGATKIPSQAFYKCASLKKVYIPVSVKTIETSAFEWCGAITDIYYGGTKEQWDAIVIESRNEELNPAVIHYNCEEIAPKADFTDVSDEKFYYGPMLWAVENKVTTGYTQSTFAPNQNCTRGQIVTFLWRAMGTPEPQSTTHVFTDVKEGEYYYKAMLWAVENGITTGYTKTTFGPKENCTRGQIVTFLHRAMQKPQPSVITHSFADVDQTKYYYDAMLWAVGEGITTGYTATSFAPNEVCTRGQIVTFLYRAMY